MKTNLTTKQFALFLRKVCEDHDEEWRIRPRSGVEDVKDTSLLSDLHQLADGDWYYFEVLSGRDSCGVYAGAKRAIFTAAMPFNKDPLFERRLLDCLAGKC
jgi:hypothetical protein